MRRLVFLALFLAALPQAFGQSASTTPGAGLPKDPRAVFTAAAALYNFNDPTLKPWHMKASYQLFDEKGDPGELGTFEYWWATPKVFRATWTRGDTTYTEWHTADGSVAYEEKGSGINFYDDYLQSAFLSPIPGQAEIDPAKFKFARHMDKLGDEKVDCIMVVPNMPENPFLSDVQNLPSGMFPTYCFNPVAPALQVATTYGSLSSYYDHITVMQGNLLPRKVMLYDKKRPIVKAELVAMNAIKPDDPSLTPTATAIHPKGDKVTLKPEEAEALLVKKVKPIQPQGGGPMMGMGGGSVALFATIGADGKVRNIHGQFSMSAALTAAALMAVAQWQYKPYLQDGVPVDFDTTINVDFGSGNGRGGGGGPGGRGGGGMPPH
jgi:hypothetical protein